MRTRVSLSVAAAICCAAGSVSADVTYVSRQSSMQVEANGRTDNDGYSGLGLYDESIDVSHPGNPDAWLPGASASTYQRSTLATTGITFAGGSNGGTGWNSRSSSFASFSNQLSVVFDLTASLDFDFAALGGEGVPGNMAIVTLIRQGDPTNTIRWQSTDGLAGLSGTLAAGRYTFQVNYQGSAGAGAPLSTFPLDVALTFVPAPSTAAFLALGLAATRRRR